MMRLGSLFSGIDGLALGVQMQTLGRVAWHAEIDPDGARVLASHWRAPNHGDLTTVDWGRVEPVDIMVGGFPCQDLSLAGKGAGIDGERSGLWGEYVRAICALRPRFVFVENVAALVARGLDRVLGDLAACGYDAAWSVYSSADVGAPHLRKRLFLLAADAAGAGLEGSDQRGAQHADPAGRGASADPDRSGLRDAEQRLAQGWAADRVRHEGRAESFDDGEASADANGERHDRAARGSGKARRSVAQDGGGLVANTAGKRRKSEGQQQRKRAVDAQAGADVARGGGVGHDTGAIPGGVLEVGRRAGARTAAAVHLNPDFVEWMMGFPPGWTAMVPRRARLRLLGNSVQPQTAMAAWDGLMARLGVAL